MSGPPGLSRETETFPVVQRTSIRLFRRITRYWVTLFRDIGRTAFGGVIDLIEGRRPRGVVNPEVFERPAFQVKWHRLQRAHGDRLDAQR